MIIVRSSVARSKFHGLIYFASSSFRFFASGERVHQNAAEGQDYIAGQAGTRTAFDEMVKEADYYRADGVRITHDPYAPGMVEKYGAPGKTDNEGFDPYRDTVGPGIYGGRVERSPETGAVIVGKQYQNHNPRPGPVYAGGGYTPVNIALRETGGKDQYEKPALRALLEKYPDLAVDESTGGAQPLHMAGMGRGNDEAVHTLCRFGADVEALDTYGMTPLHRMASNNLAVGARMLLEAGADPENGGLIGAAPRAIANDSRAKDVLKVLDEYKKKEEGSTKSLRRADMVQSLVVNFPNDMADPDSNKTLAGPTASTKEFSDYLVGVSGRYERTAATKIPPGFGSVCEQQGWDTKSTWKKLNVKARLGSLPFLFLVDSSTIFIDSGQGEDSNQQEGRESTQDEPGITCLRVILSDILIHTTSKNKGRDWFRQPESEAYVYFNSMDQCWWLDAPNGAGIYKVKRQFEYGVPAQGWRPLVNGLDKVIRSPIVLSFVEQKP
ncbi:unnamed protein product [Amoebophrya sp. A25]|nr:unnamed protein product [Amoebophrya sp. A25]|eukprot:GSA25T00012586001.1